jgi:hypothetical protein
MFKLRQAHFDAFQPLTDKLLAERIVLHLHENHAEAIGRLPDDILREMAENGIIRARSHGLTWESSLTHFVALMFEIAPNFDEHPAVRRVLREPSVPADERMDLLTERVSEEEWEEAQQIYDRDAWFPELEEDRG